MPSASTRQQDLMQKWFGSIMDAGPLNLLFSHGFTEKAGMIYKPTPFYTLSIIEIECMLFLRDEWDYDFLIEE